LISSLKRAAIGSSPRAPYSIFARVFCRKPVPAFAENGSTTWLARVATLAALLTAAILVGGALDAASAQSAPFGVGGTRPPASGPDGIIGWVLVKQAEFYRALSGALRAAKSDGSERNLPCGRTGSREGGDFVLFGCQQGDVASRHRPLVRLRVVFCLPGVEIDCECHAALRLATSASKPRAGVPNPSATSRKAV
jgi:hypothetical protein